MAKIKQGVLGGFSGSIANVTGSSWKGIAVMKSKPLSVANPNTTGQQAQRMSFKSIAMLLSAVLTTIIKPLYNPTASKMSGYNLAASINKQAFNAAGVFVPANFSLGNGNLPNVTPVEIVTHDPEDQTCNLGFLSNAAPLSPRLTDLVYALGYCAAKDMWIHTPEPIGKQELVAAMAVVSGEEIVEAGDVIEMYVGCTSLDGRLTSVKKSNTQIVVTA